MHTSNAFETLPLGAVRPRGWLQEQLRRDLREGFAARLPELTVHASRDLFRKRIASSTDHFAWWDAETRGNWLWGYVLMAHLAESPEHIARAAELVAGLLATQDDDGYIGIYSASERYRHADGENGELWAQSRALLALIAHHEFTRDASALAAVERAVDLTLRHYPENTSYFKRGNRLGRDMITGLTHGLCYVDVLEWLHRYTQRSDYAAAAARLYREFSDMPRPFPNDDLALPNIADATQPFSGHAVHTAEHLRALLFSHAVRPDCVTRELAERALERVRAYRVASGALIGDENVHGTPLPDSAYEYCTLTELSFSLTSALAKLGHAELGNWIETLAFNAVQGARTPDGRTIAYLSADTRLYATAQRADNHSQGKPSGRFKYSPTHDDVACCCNPNALRALPHYIAGMWLALSGQRGLAAAAYGACELRVSIDGVGVHIVEATDYPFSDTIELIITPEAPLEFTLLLRDASYGGKAHVTGADVVAGDGWLRLRKLWQPGDRVRIRFDWPVRTEAYANGEVAVLRGPVQYVVPIEHRLDVTRHYEVDGWYDYDVIPADLRRDYQVPVLDHATPDFGFGLETGALGDLKHPWDSSPALLRHDRCALVPIGCTILRVAAFPMR